MTPTEEITALRAALTAIRAKLEEAVCTKDPDMGVVVLDQEAPCHRDPETGISTYDLEYFSPLGEALIAAWKLTDIVSELPAPQTPDFNDGFADLCQRTGVLAAAVIPTRDPNRPNAIALALCGHAKTVEIVKGMIAKAAAVPAIWTPQNGTDVGSVRNSKCACGSGKKFKHCCGLRG